MSTSLHHDLLVAVQPRLLFPFVVIVLTAALQLLFGGNKLVLVVRVQVLMVVQKIPDRTDGEVQTQNSPVNSELTQSHGDADSQLFPDARRHQLSRLPLGAPRSVGDRQHRRVFMIHLGPVHATDDGRSDFNGTDGRRELDYQASVHCFKI